MAVKDYGKPIVKHFEYNANSIKELELALSPERLGSYVNLAGGSRAKAVSIYERNTALSEALYGVVQGLEIALRNAIHRQLSTGLAPMWFDVAPLEDYQSAMVIEAKHELLKDGRALTPSGLVAELGFGFWTALLQSRYEKSLWVPHLHKAFPHATNKNRADIHDQLMAIRKLRNRIAHHEPIVKMDLPGFYSKALAALGWICPTSSAWVRSTNCFMQRLHEKPLKYDPPKMPAVAPSPVPGKPVAFKPNGMKPQHTPT